MGGTDAVFGAYPWQVNLIENHTVTPRYNQLHKGIPKLLVVTLISVHTGPGAGGPTRDSFTDPQAKGALDRGY